MIKKKLILATITLSTCVGTVFAYKLYKATGNVYCYTTTPSSPTVPTYVKIPCHTINQNLGICTIQCAKYIFNGTTYVVYTGTLYAASNE